MHYRAFQTTEEGMQYCEEQFLAVASRHGLCRPASSVLSLEDIISLHGNVVRCLLLKKLIYLQNTMSSRLKFKGAIGSIGSKCFSKCILQGPEAFPASRVHFASSSQYLRTCSF